MDLQILAGYLQRLGFDALKPVRLTRSRELLQMVVAVKDSAF